MFCKNVGDKSFRKKVIEGKQLAIVAFMTPWSGSCHIIEPVLERTAAKHDKQMTIYRMDAEKNKKIASDYNIRVYPTLLLFHKGRIVDHFVGTITERDLTNRINNVLNDLIIADKSKSTNGDHHDRYQ